jgi:hypothetical protein
LAKLRIRLLGLCLLALPATACSSTWDCAGKKDFGPLIPPPGYASGFINGSGRPTAPTHLPANAAGVLFHTSAPADAAEFTIIDAATGMRLAARLTSMRALAAVSAMRTSDRLDMFGEQLYRVEARDGFQPGHSYRIVSRHARGAETHLHIDQARIDPASLGIGLRPAGMANREILTTGTGCSRFRQAILAQHVAFDVPPRLSPYRNFIAAFPVNQGNIAWSALPLADDWDAESLLGRDWRQAGLQTRLYMSAQADYSGTSGKSKIVAMTGFLEIEDRLYATPPLSLELDPGTVAAADSLDHLRQARRSGDRRQLLAMLEQIPVRNTDDPDAGQRKLALRASLLRLLDDTDATIRIAAGAAIVRVLQQGRPDARSVSTTVQALHKAARDNNAAVRQGAAASLLALMIHVDWTGSDHFCQQKPWRKWIAPCLDPAMFKPAAAAFAARLADKEYAVGVEAWQGMQRLGAFPALLIPALVDAPDFEGRRARLASAMEGDDAKVWLAAAESGPDPQARRVAILARRGQWPGSLQK